MNAPLIVAGALALVGTAIHGVGGELLVVRKLATDALPPSRFGGPTMTRAMIHASWHVTTAAFAVTAAALIVAGAKLDGDAARAVAIVAAAACTSFAAVVLGLGVATLSVRSIFKHPAPVLLSAIAALAWVGAL